MFVNVHFDPLIYGAIGFAAGYLYRLFQGWRAGRKAASR